MKQRSLKTEYRPAHRYALFLFLFLVLYHVLVVNRLEPWKVGEISYTYHVIDYSIGFRSQLLPGAIFYGIFGEHASPLTATFYETVLILLFFLGISFFLEKIILCTEKQYRHSAIILVLLYLTGPYTFAIFTDELGILDVNWLYISLLFFFCLRKKGLRLLIPAFFVLSLLVHFSSLLSYLILFSIMLLYQISTAPDKRKKTTYGLIFGASLAVSAGLFGYFFLFHAQNMPLSKEAFHEMLRERGATYFEYFDYSFYYKFYDEIVVSQETLAISSPVLKIIHFILDKMSFTYRMTMKSLLGQSFRLALALLLLIPLVCFFTKILYGFYKSTENNKLKKFCVFLMMIQFPFTAILGCIFSVDITRWCTHAFLVFFTMLLYVFYHEETLREQVLAGIEKQKNAFPAQIYFLAYFFTNTWAYC